MEIYCPKKVFVPFFGQKIVFAPFFDRRKIFSPVFDPSLKNPFSNPYHSRLVQCNLREPRNSPRLLQCCCHSNGIRSWIDVRTQHCLQLLLHRHLHQSSTYERWKTPEGIAAPLSDMPGIDSLFVNYHWSSSGRLVDLVVDCPVSSLSAEHNNYPSGFIWLIMTTQNEPK